MNTGVDYSCSLQWQNNYYIFGSSKEPRQVSMVNGNRLERKATLNFECSYAACTVLNQKTVLLCFGEPGIRDVCRQSNNPLGSFTKLPNSNYNHWKTRIASFEGKKKFYRKAIYASDTLIDVGGAKPGSTTYYEHTHTELFTLSSSQWQIKKDYPYSKQITLYSILAVEKMFIIFGGSRWKGEVLTRKVLTNQDMLSL